MMMRKFLLAAAFVAVPTGLVFAQDLAAGANAFKKCTPCHDVGETAKNKVGPELNGLDGRHSGSTTGFNYSDANKKSGISWNEATFFEYIKDPRAKIPGTKMVFPGIKTETEAKDLWAYLKQFGADGKRRQSCVLRAVVVICSRFIKNIATWPGRTCQCTRMRQ
jgi:cytochrome c